MNDNETKNPLDVAISKIGLLEDVGERFGKSAMAISQWRKRGVPAEHIIPLCEHAGWVVTPHDINPDLYPNKHDGLPCVSRCTV